MRRSRARLVDSVEPVTFLRPSASRHHPTRHLVGRGAVIRRADTCMFTSDAAPMPTAIRPGRGLNGILLLEIWSRISRQPLISIGPVQKRANAPEL